MTSVARNSPCPCGSGRRYKNCCGAAEVPRAGDAVALQPAASRPGGAAQPDLRATMFAALDRQQRGEHAAAEALYRQALAIEPDQPDCLHMLGVVCHELGRDREAYALVRRALGVIGWQVAPMRDKLGEI
jgi:Flp pilus assembly protein TadD